ncbi:hypothetical protein F2Q69_00012831 [Brassica cretica]|uniref:RNase H type-1 domain-containing protein n=1 Tax=Brassica cretica TaxID=69181 RepID=A0A8S9QXB3_BRACR|nr:hypothetical protein F2Q69_00012831 [Brassica cretica]
MQILVPTKPSICSAPDELMWLKTASGEYSTKSGYRAQSDTLILKEVHDLATSQDWFANVWELNTPEKIKVFLWNSLHDALPVGEQFSIRNITLSSQCPQCTEAELVLYMLFTCGYSQEVWRLSPLATNFEPSLTTTTCEGLDLFRRILSLPPIILGPVLCINQDPTLDPNRTRMYTDAAWNPSMMCAGLAWIIEDAESSSSHSAASSFVTSPLIAEILMTRNAMISALHCGINSLSVLSDSQVLINLVKSRGRHLQIAVLLNDIYLFFPLFNAIQFKFIPRLDNSRAGSVAK